MIGALAVVLHVLTTFWLIAGIVGRDFSFTQAARMTDLARLGALVDLGRKFERLMVRPATFVVLIGGLIAAWLRGWPVLGVLQGAGSNWMFVALLIFFSMVPLIVFVMLPRGKIFRRAYDAAVAAGRVTPELTATLSDPYVNAALVYELVAVAAITWLMVAKPF